VAVSEYGYLLCLVADDPPEGPYVEIGDSSNTGPSFDEYLTGWPDSA
jgi:hypothetical protein